MNEFQRKCIDAVVSFFKNTAHGKICFQEIRGENENYFVGKASLMLYAVDIYVYCDEAGFGVEGKDWIICERADYDTDADLIAALMEKLKTYLKQ